MGCGDKVTYSGKTGKGLRFRSLRSAEPDRLHQTARHKGGPRIIAITEGIANPYTDGDGIFYGSSQLYPHHIGAGINAKSGHGLLRKNLLNVASGLLMKRSHHGSRWDTPRHL